MENSTKFEGMPEGIYIDKTAIGKENTRLIGVILTEVIENLGEQTKLVADMDKQYEAAGIPLFIREQSAARLGDTLRDLTIAPIVDRLMDLYSGMPSEN